MTEEETFRCRCGYSTEDLLVFRLHVRDIHLSSRYSAWEAGL